MMGVRRGGAGHYSYDITQFTSKQVYESVGGYNLNVPHGSAD